ncbi:hypothetical protein DPMN_086407 [Dreissena polymorpha]|uniref:Uncharacterized protein n=1 Tax=Dreissena polymorpha TaxID=45954 RepID=A0A9D4QV59_DREPO|nr:hypothetical protein DPMN_086407 [Dreissena polymorpha]
MTDIYFISTLISYIAQKKYANFHEAVNAGDVVTLETLVKAGASINEVNERDKFTPLHCACNVGGTGSKCIKIVRIQK